MLLPISLMAANTTGVYNVKDYGAKGDGKALDHEAINIAIEAANKAGGGHTYFHNSHMGLCIDRGPNNMWYLVYLEDQRRSVSHGR